MANAGATPNKPSEALTTPPRRQDPIASVVTNAAKIEIQLQGPSRSPFVRHPLTSPQVTIAARCTFSEEGMAPIEKRKAFKSDGTQAKIELLLSGEQAKVVQAVEVWAEPLGQAALLDAKHGKLALGRLRFEKPLAGAQKNYALCEVHVVASVVSFIVDEMNRNLRDPAVAACRRENESAKKLEADAEKLRREAENANFLQSGFMMQSAGDLLQAAGTQRLAANARLAYRVHTASGAWALVPGGDWDHKPRIAPVWGEKNRLGDSEKVYFYDIWSNIHFGYIGRAMGFTREELLGGSDAQQRLDHGVDDESADKSSMRAGFDLYDARPGAHVTIEKVLSIVEAHDEWLYDRRQNEWKGQKK